MLPAIFTGPLLWAAFVPLNLGPLAFVALVPWLTLVRAPVSGKRLYFAGYLGGVAFFLPATQWFRVAHPMMYFSWLGLTLACPLFWLLGLFLLRRIDRLKLVPLTVSVPVVWVALEYARAHFPTGFPFLQHVGLYQMIGFGWYFLGYTQHEFTALTQVADLGGVYVVSFLVAAVNGAVAERVLQSELVRSWLRWSEPVPAGPRERTWSIITGGLLFAAVLYGIVRLNHEPFAAGPRVAAIQASVAQDDKTEDMGGLFARYNRLCMQASQDADLVVWPETCYPFGWFTILPSLDPSKVPAKLIETAEQDRAVIRFYATGRADGILANPMKRVLTPWRTNVLLGLNSYEWNGSREVPANTAILFGKDGRPIGRYDKMHLVPFGEYVPLRETFPWMKFFAPYKHDYSCRPGENWTRFQMTARDGRPFTFGCLICYEDSDPYMARQYVRKEPVDFLVNISNDGWFDGTEEHEEHVAICRFRAIEARKSVVRAVNMGISCVIDPDGRVIALPSDSWSGSKKIDGIVAADVPLDTRESRYAKLGDWLPGLCWLLLVIGHGYSVWIGRARTNQAP
ncbi:MAG: apolipoprotein N-acyltransferase [Gemmataceae bacterium]